MFAIYSFLKFHLMFNIILITLIKKCLYLTIAAEESIMIIDIIAYFINFLRFSFDFSSSRFFKLNYRSGVNLFPVFYILDVIPFFD